MYSPVRSRTSDPVGISPSGTGAFSTVSGTARSTLGRPSAQTATTWACGICARSRSAPAKSADSMNVSTSRSAGVRSRGRTGTGAIISDIVMPVPVPVNLRNKGRANLEYTVDHGATNGDRISVDDPDQRVHLAVNSVRGALHTFDDLIHRRA